MPKSANLEPAANLDVEWRGTPLKRGRHQLDPAAVKTSQRERLLRAVLECVGERGFQATTVPQIVASARVSTNTFYEFFDDKLACFLALCDQEAPGLMEATLAGAQEPTWRATVRQGVRGYLKWWEDRPAFSRAYLLEVPAAGPPAVEQRDRASEPFYGLFHALAVRARREEPTLPPMPALAPRFLALGVTELVAQEVRAGRVDRLHEIAPELEDLVVVVVIGGAPRASVGKQRKRR